MKNRLGHDLSSLISVLMQPVFRVYTHDAGRLRQLELLHGDSLAPGVDGSVVISATHVLAAGYRAPVTCEVGPRCSGPPMPSRCRRGDFRSAASRSRDIHDVVYQ